VYDEIWWGFTIQSLSEIDPIVLVLLLVDGQTSNTWVVHFLFFWITSKKESSYCGVPWWWK